MALEIADSAALMIIDFQNAIDDPRWGRRNNPGAEARANRLLEAWRRSRRPVIHVQHLSQDLNSPYQAGQPGCGFKQPLMPGPGEIIIQKRTNDAFLETGLQAALRDRSITGLIVLGVLLHNSVDATVRMARNLGYRTWLAEDATACVNCATWKAGSGQQMMSMRLASPS